MTTLAYVGLDVAQDSARVAFLLGLVDVAISFSWLLTPGRGLRDAAAVLFAVELAATALAATVTARVVLWR